MNDADAIRIQGTLARLRGSPNARSVFGADGHDFLLNPVLPNDEVEAFERRHHIALPTDYRWFLTAVGNGGAGPYYGIFPLGHMDGTRRAMKPWSEGNGFIGILSRPFMLREAWNDLSGMPSDDLAERDEDSYERGMDTFDLRYWSTDLVNGAFPVCHLGCALRIWLVVTGEERGNLWRDNRAEYGGLVPEADIKGQRVSFMQCYDAWLNEAVSQSTSRPGAPAPTGSRRGSF